MPAFNIYQVPFYKVVWLHSRVRWASYISWSCKLLIVYT